MLDRPTGQRRGNGRNREAAMTTRTRPPSTGPSPPPTEPQPPTGPAPPAGRSSPSGGSRSPPSRTPRQSAGPTSSTRLSSQRGPCVTLGAEVAPVDDSADGEENDQSSQLGK